ncbi:glutamate--tRNA ligase [candidate division FCPU426 bacterium]|nr:glutamate--tRNA ligase [candidate division FCPU426 bacterium]
MKTPVRVRFAPSPTGHLHIGGARTALFNYLFARQQNGVFILRLEDTDQARSSEDSVQMILADMQWLGLTWDEGPETGGDFGPYRQSERLQMYESKALQLLEQGKAYFCFCSPEEVEAKRQAALAQGGQPKYDGTCRALSPEQARQRIAPGASYAIRFKTPQTGETIINDCIRGRVVFDNSTLDDFVIVRSNGLPTYNFAAVVDDAAMEITHIIRGDDHLSNTPRQICLYQALGAPLPEFAHVPMILGPDKTRLSKRHGATSVGAYAEQGYLPEALVNYLALLGWSFDDKTTLFSMDELIEKFSLEKVSKNPAVFDPQKLLWMNGHYIRNIETDLYNERSRCELKKAGLVGNNPTQEEQVMATAAAGVVREKFKLMSELPQQVEYFFREPKLEALDEKSKNMLAGMKENPGLFKSLHEKLSMVESFSVSNLEALFKDFIEEKQVKFGALAHPLRVCLTGRMQSPGLFEIMEKMGKEKVLRRLASGMKAAGIL